MVIATFVFGRMLQRCREYVVLPVQGMPPRRMQLVIVDQTRYAAAGGLLASLIVGNGLGAADTRLAASLHSGVAALPAGRIVVPIGLLTIASFRSALSALAILGRLRPSEVR